MKYAIEALDYVSESHPDRYAELTAKMSFDAHKEVSVWQHIIDNMYYPQDDNLGVFLQQDGFLDKELKPVTELDPSDRPINQKWSWDRILRSVYIKQADVLQGLYLLEDQFDEDTLRRNFDFYEPLTVHESSLSPCVHAILAAKLGDQKRAYEFYLRTSRLDLDDYNNDTEDGLHITSMAGTWMSVVEGFAGMRVRDGQLQFKPFLPEKWESFSFNVFFRGSIININVNKDGVCLNNLSEKDITVRLFRKPVVLEGLSNVKVDNQCVEFQ
jgi:maltose phosphorylase